MSFVRLPNEAGIGPEKLHPSTFKEYKDLRLPIESGSSPKKLAPTSDRTSRGLLLLKSGTCSLRLGLKHT